MKIYGRKLRYLRMMKEVTQAEVAQAVGMSVNMITNIEGNMRKVKKEELEKLAEYYGVDVDYFEDNPTSNENTNNQ